jgi:anti-sigma factor RsiW
MSERYREDEARLDAYLDGELGEAERAAFERELARSPELRRALDARRDLDRVLRTLPRAEPSPWFEARFRARLARALETEERGRGRAGWTIRTWGWLVAGPAVAVAALLLLLRSPSLPDPDWDLVAGADFDLVMEEDPDLLRTLDLLEVWSEGGVL